MKNLSCELWILPEMVKKEAHAMKREVHPICVLVDTICLVEDPLGAECVRILCIF